jgi:hypothetical protein
MAAEPQKKEYDVSLSFAGEQRDYVAEVARHLKHADVRVFFDEYERARLWGRDLAEDLQQLYFARSEYVVMFISDAYRNKIWPGHEKRAALAAALNSSREYILPVKFDDAELPGINPTVRFEDARKTPPSELADLILQKLGRNVGGQKANHIAPPALPDTRGAADFNYQSYDGRYIIGKGHYLFETQWSPGPWIYNDAPSVAGVAIADVREISEVKDAASYDFTSRYRLVKPGVVVVVKNINGCYAVLKVRIAEGDGSTARLAFDYVIDPDRGTNFSIG